MSPSFSGGAELFQHRARLFPLPYLAAAVAPPSLRSARVRVRFSTNKALIHTTNRALHALNLMYHQQQHQSIHFVPNHIQSHCISNSHPSFGHDNPSSSFSFSFSSFVSSLPSLVFPKSTSHNINSESDMKSSDSVNWRVRVVTPGSDDDHSGHLSSRPSSAQLRIVLSVRRRCSSFLTSVRAATMCHDVMNQHDSDHTHTDCDKVKKKVVNHKCMMIQQHGDRNPQKHVDINQNVNMLPSSLSLSNSHSSFSSSPTAVVPLIASRISLPSHLHIVPLHSVLPQHDKELYCTPPTSVQNHANHMPCTDTQYQHQSSPPVQCHPLLRSQDDITVLELESPLRSARIAGSRREYVRLIGRMHTQGMLSFTSHPKAINGVFAVRKDDTHDRLIIDAQPANRCFIDSKHVNLPSPSHLIQLSLQRGQHMYVGKSDLSNFYHHLGLPEWMQPYFALPKLTHAEMKEIGIMTDTSTTSTHCYPMCVTVPMGFSHGVYLAQNAHLNVLYRYNSCTNLNQSDTKVQSVPFISHSSTPPLQLHDNILHTSDMTVTHHSALHGVIIDDFFIFSLNRSVATAALTRVLSAYAYAGFVVKDSKVVWPTTEPVKVIGFMIHGKEATIDLPMDSCRSLISATQAVLRSPTITATHLSHLIGRWTWLLMIRRSALAVLQQVYRFIQAAQKLRRRFQVWPSVRRELTMLLCLLPLLHARLDTPFFHRVLASDASEYAAGVVTTKVTTTLKQQLNQICSDKQNLMANMQMIVNSQRCRESVKIYTHEQSERDCLADSLQLTGFDCSSPSSPSSTSLSYFPNRSISSASESACPSLCTATVQDSTKMDMIILAQRTLDALYTSITSHPWRCLISHPWRNNSEHINVLELRAALLACHWLLSSPHVLSSRVFLLVDSAATFFSIWKGRSSSPRLLLIMRKLSAIMLSADLTLMTGWIPSKVNPADEPSRNKNKQA